MKVAIYHSILWSKYKGVVFSQVHSRGAQEGISASFIQIAETENERVALGGIDLSYHKYPYRLLFHGSYESSSILRRSIALLKDIWRNPSDLVIIPGYHRTEYWAMLLFCMCLRRRRAVFCDSTKFDKPHLPWREFAKRRFFRRCQGIFCYGIRSREYLLGYGVKEARINYRRQAAALPHDYDPAAILKSYRNSDQPDAGSPRFLYVGRLSREKGITDLLRAFASVQKTMPRASLDIVGAGPLEKQLRSETRQLRLADSVNFLGPKGLDEIATMFRASTALVLPSRSEPWGLVVNEALSYGCPVVVSNACGCVPDLVLNDNITGFTFDPADIQGLASALISSAQGNKNRQEVATRCLEIISNFTPERAALQIIEGCLRIASQPY